jgi:5-formyltetrahydrofolate cyclo-ligase
MFLAWRKSRARKQALAARKAAHAADPEAGRLLAAAFPDAVWPRIEAVVAGYRPIGSEIDPTALMETFFCEQARLALPVMQEEGEPLIFRRWQPGDELAQGAFDVEEPLDTASEARPVLVLVPLVAADKKGRRLGYGKGYYDRTLAALRAAGPVTAVGLAYEAQILPMVPAGGLDQRLDWIVTEKGAYPVC